MKTAVIYCRYSSDSQTEQSIDGQLRVCTEYAKSHDILLYRPRYDGYERQPPRFSPYDKRQRKADIQHCTCVQIRPFQPQQIRNGYAQENA